MTNEQRDIFYYFLFAVAFLLSPPAAGIYANIRRVIRNRFAPCILVLALLSGCNGPDESDMRGCTTGNHPISHRDVANCAVERAARQGEVK
jgi:hypothetical protein